MRTITLVSTLLLIHALPANCDEPTFEPEVKVQTQDYAEARKKFSTRLLRKGAAPQRTTAELPPDGVEEIEYTSGSLKLDAWIAKPADGVKDKLPAVLFLHGGFGFGHEDWEMAAPFRKAGFVVMMPMLRGENGQDGDFSLFYDEVDDVLAAAAFLKQLEYVDPQRLFVAGHSVGGTHALLAAEASGDFRAAASLSGSPDQILYCRFGFPKEKIPFDQDDPRELEMRSPLAYAASLRCPTRLFFGSEEEHWKKTSERTAEIAREHGKDVKAVIVKGDHFSAVAEEMQRCIEFFREVEPTKTTVEKKS